MGFFHVNLISNGTPRYQTSFSHFITNSPFILCFILSHSILFCKGIALLLLTFIEIYHHLLIGLTDFFGVLSYILML